MFVHGTYLECYLRPHCAYDILAAYCDFISMFFIMSLLWRMALEQLKRLTEPSPGLKSMVSIIVQRQMTKVSPDPQVQH